MLPFGCMYLHFVVAVLVTGHYGDEFLSKCKELLGIQ